jgi:hypothetical protein
MLKNLFSRFRLSRSGFVCVLVFAIGVFLRWRYIAVNHDPRNFIDAEMKTYIDIAKLWFSPGYTLGPSDVFLPPGTAKLFSSLVHVDPTMRLAVHFMFTVTALVPLVFMALAWAAFGKPIAKGTLIVTSLYPLFITYGGYFFIELPMALLLGLSLTLYLWAARMKSPRAALGLALGAGIALSVAMGFRLVALPAMMVFATVFTLFFRGPVDPPQNIAEEASDAPPGPARWFNLSGPMRKIKLLTLAGVIAGAIPLTAAMSVRCTIGNGNRFCLVSNRNSAEVLLGHYGRLETITWSYKGSTVELGSAASPKHAYNARPTFAFAATNEAKNFSTAWKWTRKNAPEALLLTFERVYDTFGGSFSWPQAAQASWLLWEATHFFFGLFLMLPALFLNFDVGTAKGLRALLGSREFLILSPILGLIAAVLVTTGEERYRIPFDGLFIIGAVVFYHRFAAKKSEVASSALAVLAPAAEAVKKRFAWVRPWHTDVLCALLFVGSVYLRWRYITVYHDPRKYVFSDPRTYVEMGERWANESYKTNWSDAMVPPGIGYVFAALFKLDPTKLLAVHFMFLISSILPLVILGLGWAAFSKAVGKGAMVFACFYVTLIAYGSFFVTEIPMTLLFMLSLCVFLWATRVKSRWVALGMALMAGFLCALAASFKLLAMPAVLFFSIVYTLFYRAKADADAPLEAPDAPRSRRRWFNFSGPLRTTKLILIAGLIAGALPVMVALSVRCTRINDNKFCLVCSNAPQNFLLGHYGRIGSVAWKSSQGIFAFGSSAKAQHGYTERKEVPFGINDAKNNNAEGWRWIKQNPTEAVVLSLEHVFDAFGGSVAWPPNVTPAWIPSQLSQYGFLVFMMLPALWLCVDVAKRRGLRGFLASSEFLILSPNIGVIGSVAAATGEARYRIPFDGLFIIVGVAFYNRYLVNRSKQAIAAAGEAPPEETGAADGAEAPALSAANPEAASPPVESSKTDARSDEPSPVESSKTDARSDEPS